MQNILSSNNVIRILLFYSALVPFFDTLNIISLYLFIPYVFLFCICRYKVYYNNRYIVILSCLVLFILFSCFTTNYIDYTIKELKALLGTLLLCYIVSSLSTNKSNIPFLYSLWIAYYIGMILYIPQMDVFQNFDYSKDRLNDGQLNANTIAYHTFYLTFAIFILGEIRKKKALSLMFFAMVPLSFIVALITGSRQVLLIQIPLVALLTCIRYYHNFRHAKVYILGLFVATAIALFAVEKGKDIFEHSVLATRYEKKMEKDSRPKLLKDAMKVGCEHPILGVGPGNYVQFSYNKHFSHCTYTELFANCGIFAVFVYFYLLWTFLKKQILYYRKTKDKIFIAFFVFGIIYIFDNFFYVFYTMLWLFPFFFLVASHSEYHYKELKKLIDENSFTCY